jgi:hypothetical protein
MRSDDDTGVERDASQENAERNDGAQNPYVAFEKPLHRCVAT